MEVDEEGQDPDLMAPKPKKRKRATKGVPPSKEDPYARFAAELQNTFFIKVSSTIQGLYTKEIECLMYKIFATTLQTQNLALCRESDYVQ